MPKTVHPRVCGEQSICARRSSLAFGSSPRVRGTVYANPDATQQMRFIPACAGNSLSGSASASVIFLFSNNLPINSRPS